MSAEGDSGGFRIGGCGRMFAGLQEIGINNGGDLKETLTNCTEPLKAIEVFQVLPPA